MKLLKLNSAIPLLERRPAGGGKYVYIHAKTVNNSIIYLELQMETIQVSTGCGMNELRNYYCLYRRILHSNEIYTNNSYIQHG